LLFALFDFGRGDRGREDLCPAGLAARDQSISLELSNDLIDTSTVTAIHPFAC